MIQEGSRVGGFRLDERIGMGASGIVFKGVQVSSDREVVLKFLPPVHNDVERSRFFREAAALRRMSHPNIVQVLDTGDAEGMPYMVFDYVPFGSLGERMEQGPLAPAEALSFLAGIARGLDYAHEKGIVHRDIKPANILIDRAGVPVIADFGLVRLLDSTTATMAGTFAGTPAYMSPEQAEGHEIWPASDQYSLAAMAYELITGQVPFPGDTVSEVLTALLTKAPEPPSHIRTGLSPEVDSVLLKGLAKKPAERWQSCGELVDELIEAMVTTLPLAAVATAGATPAVAATSPAKKSDPRVAALEHLPPSEPYLTIVMPYSQVKRGRRGRRWLVSLVAAAVILGTLAIGLAWSGHGIAGALAWTHLAAAAQSVATH